MRGFLLRCTMVFGLEMLLSLSVHAQAILPDSMEPEEVDIGRTREILHSTHLPGLALLEEIENWLCAQFKLPRLEHYPRIELVPAATIISLRQTALWKSAGELPADSERGTIAIYEDSSRTIYLPANWNGSTAIEQSILVHEMVHHFQSVLGIQYECAQAREKLAYLAQDRWLGRSGHSLAADFQLDPFSLLLSTTCPYLN